MGLRVVGEAVHGAGGGRPVGLRVGVRVRMADDWRLDVVAVLLAAGGGRPFDKLGPLAKAGSYGSPLFIASASVVMLSRSLAT